MPVIQNKCLIWIWFSYVFQIHFFQKVTIFYTSWICNAKKETSFFAKAEGGKEKNLTGLPAQNWQILKNGKWPDLQ